MQQRDFQQPAQVPQQQQQGGGAPSKKQHGGAGGGGGYSAVGDSFGLLGLQPVVTQASDTIDSANMLMLTRGFDLNQLGLQLVQQDPLSATFSSPWLDTPPTIQPDFKIPSCYVVQSPHIKYTLFQRFQLETLFYVFYSMPRDILQMAAAHELYNRDWRYHKQLRMWLTKPPGEEPTVKQQHFERGNYVVWNADAWQKERREDFMLEYSQLEEKNDPAQQQQQQQAGAGGAVQPTPPQQQSPAPQ